MTLGNNIKYYMQHKSAATPAAPHATCAGARTHTQTSVQLSASAEADANLTMNILAVQVCMSNMRQDRWKLKQHNSKQI
jgi:hypothetical protein